MALRGKKPSDRTKRLKLLMSGPAGVGKTMASIQMPRPYIIDTEAGSVHYDEEIEAAGGIVFETQSIDEAITEVRALMTEPHDYRTLVVDPITILYDRALEDAEAIVGADYGRHYNVANLKFKRLCNLLTQIDMNVIITAHEKVEYGPMLDASGNPVKDSKGEAKRVVIGTTFDAYKKLNYVFDLYIKLSKDSNGKRWGFVDKTRFKEFPDMDRFEWRYETLAERFGADRLEEKVEAVELATKDQIEKFKFLMHTIGPEAVKKIRVDAVVAAYDDLTDMPSERMAKGIELMEEFHNKESE